MDRSEIADLLPRTDFRDGMHEIGGLGRKFPRSQLASGRPRLLDWLLMLFLFMSFSYGPSGWDLACLLWRETPLSGYNVRVDCSLPQQHQSMPGGVLCQVTLNP
ncbi:hypothetical protein H112_01869 [Trichophyton rubrum D6]|uniref:Uncharacterized protein n=3 Tax=Trichophyton TaxID=5550 RepID=A0A080WWF4_TRIRC|nr:uncharacterized protein TERG_12432 [Trichophyton rubrum CBS 118892]EZF25854.1 hypothetical protein H100_01865 [Trichophyton rubrum MR850]EZF44831.1 hypothetical protein H102_01863 [Trichophyton rubrum CBS 100081]EZF55483.1 hypothetical protein H103_01874 [Trichophyton rubrum CBS 288.86]EZF66063.1 hypothetical protein H104_01848 [Trichophyton rubrum CBS 289.86]EZF76833.1 hypothetical protein H105_01879 [Trichophyton soudanense CBS 452.61]EZF87517.1 hypothetical protein H110_01872 [Trichophy